MHILHVFKVYYPDSYGGIEQVIRQLARSQTHGVTHEVFTLSRHARGAQRELEIDGVRITRARTHLAPASTPISFSALAHFRRAVARADVVQYHFPWPFGDVLHFAAGVRVPAIVTYHSDIVRQRLLMPVYAPLMHRFLDSMHAIVATSPNYLDTSDVLRRHRGRVHTIPIGLDATECEADPGRVDMWRGRVGEGFFLFVGVIRYYKGLHILMQACRDAAFRVVILGTGPQEDALRQQAAALGLDNVSFLGVLPDADKHALLSLCRGVVFPSHLRSEAFGVTLLEGAMFGKPLVSSEIGTGSSYVNLHGHTGYVVPPSDPHALRAALARLHADPALAESLGRNARARFVEKFSAGTMRRRYHALYESVLRDGAAAAPAGEPEFRGW
ncbi:Glycosyl transferase, group 1 [Cupriavidus phytorum]|uniref:Glycosyl transferase, group 1 n=2 Tax=Cupriavidus TaxID=106589 RepID=A0A975XBT9_9BURK|nr:MULTISPECIES: glycosyltransferase [Cupriavidus]PZX33993.1 rhamnosyl/mannosyltransferase [Cupriavidus alkaliphilus]SOY65497.1 Glycosyl transferase, group 1 [Cupriavidus taiwanensis]